ncbi:MAG: PQQ-dependent sugar dehydrogenase [Candidatus Nanohaloarchaea archaeon]|nr:PQQ-dependent sugar dehydrogenase [Candidatus Nanohaloarchaea archaeon]
MDLRKASAVSIVVGFGLLLVAGIFLQDDLKRLYFQSPDSDLNGASQNSVEVKIVATGLEVPWGIEFLPSGDLLVTERGGTLRRIGQQNRTYSIPGVRETGESGLLGIELHPNFSKTRWLYLYHTRKTGDRLTNRVIRYKLEDGELQNPNTVISGLPGAIYHDGGRIEFGPDRKLYITVGDATEAPKAQNTSLMNGKILRLNADGTVPDSNPFNNPVYSYGHRNPQGLAWIGDRLWATEHGDDRHDELNRIVKGGNYGWPVIEADQSREDMIKPEIYAKETTWAPAGAAYHKGSIFFAGLRGSALYEAELENQSVERLRAHFKREFGRLRAVELGPKREYLYLTTSNRDGRGRIKPGDDRILKVDLNQLD